MRTQYPFARLSALAAFTLTGGLVASPLLAEESEDRARSAEVVAQAETPESTRDRQAGPARDPLDPVPARTRAMQLGGGDQRVGAGTRFNPAMSVILDGLYYNELSGHVDELGGFDAGHDHGHGHGDDHGLRSGFQMREVEFALSGTVDPYFDAFVMFAFENGEVDLEEAYITSRNLPAGLQLKAGHFLSDIGYINKQHTHDWTFVDRPWMNELLFGDHGLQETGIQMSWMPATRSYTRFGVELLNGNSSGVAPYIGSGDHEIVTVLPGDPENGDFSPDRNRWRADTGFDDVSGPRLATIFAKWAPNLGYDHALQLGAFAGQSRAYQRDEAHSSGRYETWDGDASFWGVDAVYKRDGDGVLGHRNFLLQFEYATREIDATYMSRQFSDFSTLELTTRGGTPDTTEQRWKQDGFYLQAVYGIAPRWNWGVRVDGMGLTNNAYADHSDGRGLPTEFETSWRYSTQLTYAPTEFSRFRAQINNVEMGGEHGHDDHDHHDAWELMLQYNISFGVHGAHAF